MKKIRGRTPELTCLHLLLDIVLALFLPKKAERKKKEHAFDIYNIPAVTKKELAEIWGESMIIKLIKTIWMVFLIELLN